MYFLMPLQWIYNAYVWQISDANLHILIELKQS